MKLFRVFLLLFPIFPLLAMDGARTEMRRWTSDVDSTILARFVELRPDDTVVLKAASGRIIEIPRRRLSPEDRKWLNNTIIPEPAEATLVAQPPEPEVAQQMDDLTADLSNALASYAASQGITRISLDAGGFSRGADEISRRHAVRTVSAQLVQEENLVLLAAPGENGVQSGEQPDPRKILVDLLVDENHREGYLALSVPHPDEDFPEWMAGGYFTITDVDRGWLEMRPTARSDHYLPRLKPETLVELAELRESLASCSASWVEPDSPGSLEHRLMQALIVQQLVLPKPDQSSGVEETVAESSAGRFIQDEANPVERVSVLLDLEKVRESMGISTYDLRVIQEETGRLLALKSPILERERETMAFLRQRMQEYWDVVPTGDVDRVLEICRWVSEGQRRTLISSTRLRYENYLSRTNDYRHEISEVNVLGDCAEVLVRTIYVHGSGSGLARLVVDQGEWKIWSFEKPQLGLHQFSPEQQERLLELREWGWDQLNIPEEQRERMR